MALKKHVSPHGTVTAVSMMKDEAPYLLEWIAHHLALGFTDILVYTNDCTDGTDDMLIRLEELGLAHHRRNDIPEGRKPQPSALKYAQQDPIVQNSDWILVFDADEFLCIKSGDGTVDSLISDAGDANGIVITWRIYGSGHVEDWSRDPVVEQYLHAAPQSWNKGWGVKTLFKFDPEYWNLGIHRPKIKNKHLKTNFPDTIKWVNGSLQPMEDYFKFRGWRSIRRTVGYGCAQMNHYAIKSVDAYAMRRVRGNVNLKKDKYNADYWALQDRNEVEDPCATRHAEKRGVIFAELLKDPILNDLHHAALKKFEGRLADIKKTPEYATLKAGLAEAGKIKIGEVVAAPPTARDPARIAAMMSGLEKTTVEREKKERLSQAPGDDFYLDDLDGIPIENTVSLVENHDVRLPTDTRIFTPTAIAAINAGKFDRRNARLIRNFLNDRDRFMDVGAGVCFIPILVCSLFDNITVLAQETRTSLVDVGRSIAIENNLASERLKITDDPLHVSENGKLIPGGLQTLIKDFHPTVLRISDDAVTQADMDALNFGDVKRVIISTDKGQEALIKKGYVFDDESSTKELLVFNKARLSRTNIGNKD